MECGDCAGGPCVCIMGQCRCLYYGSCAAAEVGASCGICGVCTESGSCDELMPGGQGTFKKRLCYNDVDCPTGFPVCETGGCARPYAEDLGYCRKRNQAARRLTWAPDADADAGAGAGARPELHRRLRGLGSPAVAQPGVGGPAGRRLSSAELNALMHAGFRAQRRLLAAGPAPVPAPGPAPAASAAAAGVGGPPAVATAPAPAPGDDFYLLQDLSQVDGTGGSIYIVTSTGQLNTSAVANQVLGDLAGQVAGIMGAIKNSLTVTGGSSISSLWNTLFWVAVALAGTLALHAALRALLIWRKWRMRMFLEWPRPELWLMWAVLPILAAQGAVFVVSDSSGEVAAGVIFGILLPLALVAMSFYLVIKHLTMIIPLKRAAYFVPDEEAEKVKKRRKQRLERLTSSVTSDSDPGAAAGPSAARTNSGNRLERGSLSGVSDVSRASAGGSAAGAELLAPVRRVDSSAEALPGAEAPAEAPQRPPFKRRLKKWLLRWVARPVFGYDPSLAGEWVPPNGYEVSFVARYGVLFETSRGPDVVYRPGTFEFDPATGKFDRGEMVPVADTRWLRAKEVARTLGVTVQLTKLVLFAQLAAVFGASSSISPLWQVVPMLVLIVVYWTYMRFFVPMATFQDMAAEILGCACDMGTFVCGVILAVTPVSHVVTINNVGIAMILFQLTSMIITFFPPIAGFLAMAVGWVWGKMFPSPADKLAAAVLEVMSKDERVLSRKYADRWLLKTHGRGLNQRALYHYEKQQQLLPFGFALRPGLVRMRAFGAGTGGDRRQAAADTAAEAVAEAAAAAAARGEAQPQRPAGLLAAMRASALFRASRGASSTPGSSASRRGGSASAEGQPRAGAPSRSSTLGTQPSSVLTPQPSGTLATPPPSTAGPGSTGSPPASPRPGPE